MLAMAIPGAILLLSLSIVVNGDNRSQNWPEGELEGGTIKWLVKRVVELESQGTVLLKRLDRQEQQLQSQSLVIKNQEKLLLKNAREAEELRILVKSLNHTVKDQGLDITRLKTSNRLLQKSNVIHNPISSFSNYRKSRIQPEGTITDSENTTHLLTNKVKHSQNELPGIRRSEVQKSKRLVVVDEGPVAFHAVIDKQEVSHLGQNQNIVFDIVLENLGGAYHNQHGVFIAPRDGVYLFSVSIMSYISPHPEVEVELKKDGVTLARVFAHGDNGREDQGSVTIVTKMNQGNEVWASLQYPDGTSIYGNRWSSFMGCLIYAV